MSQSLSLSRRFAYQFLVNSPIDDNHWTSLTITVDRMMDLKTNYQCLSHVQLYQMHREDPPLARNMPPVAGRIVWVRQLYRRIEEPIDYIQVGTDRSLK